VTKQTKVAECVFRKGFVTEVIDQKVNDLWRSGFGVVRVPFGDLRNMFRRHHCRTINPYGDSDRCPFDKKECAYAFLDAVRLTVNARPRVPVGYFIRVAKSTAAIRADEAVERRAAAARLRRTDVNLSPAPDALPTSPAAAPGDVPRGVGSPPSESHRPRREGSLEQARPATGESGSHPIPADASVPRMGDGPVGLGDLLRGMETRPRQGRSETGSEGR
jgi:hypothetical protein